MWQRLAGFVLKYRLSLLVLLLISTGVMAYFASKVQMSYDYVATIPHDNPRYLEFQEFKNKFGADGNTLVLGVQTDKFFQEDFFRDYVQLNKDIKEVSAVENIMSVPMAVNLVKNDSTQKLEAGLLFKGNLESQATIDSLAGIFNRLPFYKGLLFNPDTHAYLMAIYVNKDVFNSPKRTAVVAQITKLAKAFEEKHHTEVRLSGLPLIRTVMAVKVADELKLFLKISFLLTGLILFLFFRSLGAVLMSMIVVAIGVVWSVATIVLMGYKITLLTGLIPSLIVVIGIPNCVYFLSKYHTEYAKHGNKTRALVRMIQRMGIVTLFTNITAAIGFGVFCFTNSAILKEFGVVAGLNIMFIFLISFIFLPSVLSYLPAPKTKHTSHAGDGFFGKMLDFLTMLVFKYRPWVYGVSVVLLVLAIVGMGRLKSVGYMLDDIPKTDKLFTDLKFFEKNFKGVMPLEIAVDTKRKNGVINLQTLNKLDELTALISAQPDFGRPLSVVEGIKFAKQAYYNGDSSNYAVPNQFDLGFLAPYLRMKGAGSAPATSTFSKLVSSYMDSTKQVARLSVNMKDVGSQRLPVLMDSLRPKVTAIFDTAHYKVTFTGTSVIFQEGTRFIINGLTESILLAFVLIMGCMLYLFRSWRMLLISLIPNIIPLVVTAGVMGWLGVALKPSTVLVFSVALGIAIDVTIRFLVNFKQELPRHGDDISATVKQTIHETGLSIIYTSLILFAGFMIFSFSGFGGTKALGWLTSLTLIVAMITNLTILPALLLWMEKALLKKAKKKELWNTLDEEEDIEIAKLGISDKE
ncbi:efflux RND transporter permease subunit [Chitinophaga nivalis]|uniref:Efflux RND transporter permease subunit n=1 Tax=Chitinophaga nivalis TaxID=2991709 RepID=A0ABT3IUC5_9BACT|nr:efflux RND transporter permease subunit [Chitinophaga nivalis]MCW3462712.1 efflux RND transporter permease subunit [Chitinophaga nivalis]MCW3487597.1 efflux RND transporter permease subunit [Chitinophaga nivalis]